MKFKIGDVVKRKYSDIYYYLIIDVEDHIYKCYGFHNKEINDYSGHCMELVG